MSKRTSYFCWAEMKRRCSDPRAINYKNYGGREITFCDRWQKYENFQADMGPRPDGTSLGRIDNNKNYSPENCRWETRHQQNSNKRLVASQRNNTTGIIGVFWLPHRRKWQARFGGRILYYGAD